MKNLLPPISRIIKIHAVKITQSVYHSHQHKHTIIPTPSIYVILEKSQSPTTPAPQLFGTQEYQNKETISLLCDAMK